MLKTKLEFWRGYNAIGKSLLNVNNVESVLGSQES